MFKVGDKVRRVRDQWGAGVPGVKGFVGVVTRVKDSSIGFDNGSGWWFSYNYELVEPATPDFESYELIYEGTRFFARYSTYAEAEERAKGLVDGGHHESMTIVGRKSVEIATVSRPPICVVVTKHT